MNRGNLSGSTGEPDERITGLQAEAEYHAKEATRGGDVAVAVVVDTVEFVIVSRTQPPPSDIGRAGSLSDTLII